MNDFSCEKIREFAAIKCKNNSDKLALIYLVYSILTISLNIDSEKFPTLALGAIVINIIMIILAGPMEYGISKVIKLNYHNQDYDTRTLFDGFKGKVFGTFFLQTLYVFLWMLLLIIPGVIKAIAYSMTYYVMLDNPDLGADECITKSKELMSGYKADYFVLMLTYLGWKLLSILTLGILMLWVGPKIKTAQYHFYLKIKTKNKTNDNLVEI